MCTGVVSTLVTAESNEDESLINCTQNVNWFKVNESAWECMRVSGEIRAVIASILFSLMNDHIA